MTAIEERKASGIRLMDPGRDLRQVADLIEDSFAGEYGPGGLAAARDLRTMANLGSVIWILSRLSTEFRESFTGFVWVDGGRVVGNVTLNRVKPGSNRWQISNVAVARSHRGRGIGRRLTQAALELAQAQGGEWAVLQVRQDNAPAMHIYRSLGFESLYACTELSFTGPAPARAPAEMPEGYTLRRCRPSDWQQEYELALAATPPAARWLRGIEVSEFRRGWPARLRQWLGDWLAGGESGRYGLFQGQTLVAIFSWRVKGWEDQARIRLRVHPEHRGLVEDALVQDGLSRLRLGAGVQARAEHPADHPAGIAAFQRFGFKEVRTLVTMRRAL